MWDLLMYNGLRWTWRTGKSALMVDLVHVDDVLRLLLDLSHIQRPDPDHHMDSLGGRLTPINPHRLFALTVRSWVGDFLVISVFQFKV